MPGLDDYDPENYIPARSRRKAAPRGLDSYDPYDYVPSRPPVATRPSRLTFGRHPEEPGADITQLRRLPATEPPAASGASITDRINQNIDYMAGLPQRVYEAEIGSSQEDAGTSPLYKFGRRALAGAERGALGVATLPYGLAAAVRDRIRREGVLRGTARAVAEIPQEFTGAPDIARQMRTGSLGREFLEDPTAALTPYAMAAGAVTGVAGRLGPKPLLEGLPGPRMPSEATRAIEEHLKPLEEDVRRELAPPAAPTVPVETGGEQVIARNLPGLEPLPAVAVPPSVEPPVVPPPTPRGQRPVKGFFETEKNRWVKEQKGLAEASEAPFFNLIAGEGGVGYQTLVRVIGRDAAKDFLRSPLNQRYKRQLVSAGKGKIGADVLAERLEAEGLADFSGSANKEGALADLLLEKARAFQTRDTDIAEAFERMKPPAQPTPVGDLITGAVTGKELRPGDTIRTGPAGDIPPDTYRVVDTSGGKIKLADGKRVTVDAFDQLTVEEIYQGGKRPLVQKPAPVRAEEVPGTGAVERRQTVKAPAGSHPLQFDESGALKPGPLKGRDLVWEDRGEVRSGRYEDQVPGPAGSTMIRVTTADGESKYFQVREGESRVMVGPKEEPTEVASQRTSIDHGILSPSGRVSERSRQAAIERTRKELFGEEGLEPPSPGRQPSGKESDLSRASELRDLASRGMKPRAYAEEAARLEEKWKEPELPGGGFKASTAEQLRALELEKRRKRAAGPEAPKGELFEAAEEQEFQRKQGKLPGTAGGAAGSPMEAQFPQRLGGEAPVPAQMAVGPTAPKVPMAEGADPISPHQVRKFLEARLQVPIRTGLYRSLGKQWAGFFKVKQEAIRVWKLNGLPTIAHEVGHFLDKVLGLNLGKPLGKRAPKGLRLTPEQRAMQQELLAAGKRLYGSRRPTGGYAAEGVAEWFKFHLTDPARAAREFPLYSAEVGRRLDGQPYIRDTLLEARRLIEKIESQPNSAKVLAQMSIGKERSRPMTAEGLVADTYDSLNSLRLYTQEMLKTNPNSPHDAYQAAMLHAGWTAKADEFLLHRAIDTRGKRVGPGLKQVLEPVSKKLDDLRVLLAARHTIEHLPKGKMTGLTFEEAKGALDELKGLSHFGELEKAAEGLYRWQDSLLKYLVDGHILKAEAAKTMRETYFQYIPWYRLVEGNVSLPGSGRFANIFSPIKRMKGGTQIAIDPLESMVRNAYTFVNRVESNKPILELYRLARDTEGAGRWIEIVPVQQEAQKVPIVDAIRQLYQAGLVEIPEPDFKTFLESLPADSAMQTVIAFRPSVMGSIRKGLTMAMEHGRAKFMVVKPEELQRAILSIGKEDVPALVRILSMPARALRAGATWMNLAFTSVNFLRDQMTAFLQSDYGMVPFIDPARAMRAMYRNDPIFQEFRVSGASRGTLASFDRDYAGRALQQIAGGRRVGPLAGPLQRRINAIANRIRAVHPVDAVRLINEYVENSTRLAEYRRAREGVGRVRGALTVTGRKAPETVGRAARAAQEVTVNFSRVGNSMRAVNMISAFYNANLQAVIQTGRIARGHPSRTLARVAVGVTIPSAILYSLNHDDPEYKALPPWRKDLFWNAPLGSGERHGWVTIPKPHLYGLLGGSLLERGLEWFEKKDPSGFKDFSEKLLQAALPGQSGLPTPTIATAIGEWWANKSAWTGQATVPESRKEFPPEMQYRKTTGPTAKAIGKVGARMGLSLPPAKVEQFVRSTAGGVGTGALQIADIAGRKAGLYEPAEEGAPSVTAPERLPVLSRFYYRRPEGEAGGREDYDRYIKGEALYRSHHKVEQEGTPAEIRDFERMHGKELEDYMSERKELTKRFRKAPARKPMKLSDALRRRSAGR
jgi:hypothetical protein